MFNGGIICRSKEGQGSNFIFIVELSENQFHKKVSNRIMNPNLRTYSKLEFRNIIPNNIESNYQTQSRRIKKNFGFDTSKKQKAGEYDISKHVNMIMKETKEMEQKIQQKYSKEQQESMFKKHNTLMLIENFNSVIRNFENADN